MSRQASIDLKHFQNCRKRQSNNKAEEIMRQMQQKIDQKDTALKYFKEKAKKLENNLENTKIFLNMVIHDLRNPAESIKQGLQ